MKWKVKDCGCSKCYKRRIFYRKEELEEYCEEDEEMIYTVSSCNCNYCRIANGKSNNTDFNCKLKEGEE
jgi:hypothetical protein